MDYTALLSAKSNIFDHVLYEFEMYIQTYRAFPKCRIGTSYDQFLLNALLESHAVHLRNLIEFFNGEIDCITTDIIFVGAQDLSFDDTGIHAKQTVNKTIEHLTKERVTWNQTEKDLTIRTNDVIHKMFETIIVPRITECVKMLIQETDVKSELVGMLHDEQIQNRLIFLSEICMEITGEKSL